MRKKDESGPYALVDPDEFALDSPGFPPSPRHSRLIVLKTVVCVQLVNVILLVLAYFVFIYRPASEPGSSGYPPSALNVSKTFVANEDDLRLVSNNTGADYYWMSLTKGHNNGLVSLPKAWAQKQRLQSSSLATEDGEAVFQVDAYHQLHCLQRLRQDIINAPQQLRLDPHLTAASPYRAHTLHCIDYLRQALVCNADDTLVSAGKDLEFTQSPPRQCRDFDALSEWVARRAWNADKWFGVGLEAEAQD